MNIQNKLKEYAFVFVLFFFGYKLQMTGSLYVQTLDYLYNNSASIMQSGNTCICVPPGSCHGYNDGSGLIDYRIMINGVYQQPNVGPTTVTPIGPILPSNALFSGSCLYGLTKCCRAGKYRCGERFPPPPGSPTPAAGQAPFGAYPWNAALLLKEAEQYIGGGALVDYKHIITAAHKVYNITAASLKVRLGEWNSNSNNDTRIPPRDYNVSRIYIHPNFQIQNLFNDIALISLSTHASLGSTSTIATACLTGENNYYNTRCFISGWGKINYNSTFSTIQRHVRVIIKPPGVCQDQLRKTKLGNGFAFNSQSFTCAGGETGKDACTGDGGSPLVCEMSGRWAVLGLVAWGIGCGINNVPGVYVNVPTYLPWIENIIKGSQ